MSMQLTESLSATAPTRLSIFRIPFLTTTPLWDVKALFYLLPVWWLLGLEQFIWPPVLTWSLFKLLKMQQFRLRILPPVGLFFVYLFFYLVSSFFIIEAYRIMTFVRSFSYNYAAFCILLIITNLCWNDTQIRSIIKCILIIYAVSVVLGILAVLGIFRPSFTAPTAYLMPNSIQNMQLVEYIINQTFGNTSWFTLYGGRYFRLSSFGLFHTHYATALAITIPLLIWAWQWSRAWLLKACLGLLIVFAIINLGATASRVAFIGFLGGGLYFGLRYVFKGKIRTFVYVGLFSAASAFIILLATGAIPHVNEAIVESANSFLYARGSGSVTSRTSVYIATIEGWLERPILGWGTERHVPGMRFPAGSHSYYLGILYKQGVVGLLIFGWLGLSLWRHTNPARGQPVNSPRVSLLRYSRWILLALAVNGLTDAIDLDAILMITVAMLIAVLLVWGRQDFDIAQSDVARPNISPLDSSLPTSTAQEQQPAQAHINPSRMAM